MNNCEHVSIVSICDRIRGHKLSISVHGRLEGSQALCIDRMSDNGVDNSGRLRPGPFSLEGSAQMPSLRLDHNCIFTIRGWSRDLVEIQCTFRISVSPPGPSYRLGEHTLDK